MNGLPNSIQLAGKDGKQSRFQTVRMAQGEAVRSGSPLNSSSTQGSHDWAGKGLGIRQPYPTETQLSWAEVNHWFATGPHA